MKRTIFLLSLFAAALWPSLAHADRVVMKDGTVYTGKIQVDNGKSILIGNPPFDPNAYLLDYKDIDKVVYEEYHLSPPATRKRGLQLEARVNGNAYSSDQLPLKTAPSLYLGAGFRMHPLIEIDGGVDWAPGLRAKTPFNLSNNATPPQNRAYQDFHMWRGVFTTRLYPFYKETWRVEPYALAGYSWGRLTPSGSGDTFKGGGWSAGAGAIMPLATHLFLEGRVAYESLSFNDVSFLGESGTLNPAVDEHAFTFSLGVSWRL